MYRSTYMCTQKFSPRFPWFLKIDVKLGSRSKIQNYWRVDDFAVFLSLEVRFWNTRTRLNFENHTSNHQLDIKSLQCPLKVQEDLHKSAPITRVYRWIRWDGTVWKGYQKCVSFNICEFIENVYTFLFIYTPKLSPLLWLVLKFDV